MEKEEKFTVSVKIPEPNIDDAGQTFCTSLCLFYLEGNCKNDWGVDINYGTDIQPGPGCPRYKGAKGEPNEPRKD